ncbi:MAG: hypothetical protein CGU28_00615 [Candidatus Dactylopiibacterium carminicum]|uniref:Protein Smg homolog n=1 Tax=Candidatus Dactylopiibacterium carminicum TaxID=857335 RepID=A0A272EYV1_9RHOO|nr:DUF494 domain-containing protein [Candidatus Dactylopiibacterium carminicum]KAF7600803.1 DUF494 domain-containing protein [Candidatus Dactylopiibacterium carminicum]PAS95302.1 MAG: hypothetical protein CGU29_00195 [Candidatus Dactylopiibacterium carminicum]PAS98686.1 MAG: hypothetical protein CGU28_00615 [Candidatus Dactylopiibacterium carminicum]PAT00810.1 MAG: hypothetical protein BSR46_00160 [Candidatus Dactylopiibacterium carminicum]
MIDILVYLFETYGYADACPEEPEQLTRKLSAAGFASEDIAEAIDWLRGLRLAARAEGVEQRADKQSMRILSEHEASRLDLASRGFLCFLEHTGVLDQRRRELVIERAMAMPETEVDLSSLKVIVLMVLWQERASVDSLILEELLSDECEEEDAYDRESITLH